MKANNQTALVAGSMFLAGISLVLLIGETKGQGALDPDEAPAPSMKSLDEISNQIAELGGEYRESNGKNMLVVLGTKASAMTETIDWTSTQLTGLSSGEEPDFILESEGNFLIVVHQNESSSRVWAFKGATAEWFSGGPYSTVTRVAASKGGILSFSTSGSAGKAYGFRPGSGTFDSTSDSGPVSALVGSN